MAQLLLPTPPPDDLGRGGSGAPEFTVDRLPGSLAAAAFRQAVRGRAYARSMGIISWGTYLPESRLDRGLIGAALGTPAGAGTRSVAGYDEDTTSMGVEAARQALANLAPELMPQRVLFATANPAYLDKTNATAIHAALGLPSSAAAFDVGGAVRSGIGAMMLATQATVPTLVVVSDIRTGRPGGADEREGGDGAAAFVMASADTMGDAMQ